MFEEITSKAELDQLLYHLRKSARELKASKDITQAIITRKIQVPEFVRTMHRKLFPQLQQMILEVKEQIAEAKARRSNVQSKA
jgi:hypothetical protein